MTRALGMARATRVALVIAAVLALAAATPSAQVGGTSSGGAPIAGKAAR